MNRRGFLVALVGLAAVPLSGKLLPESLRSEETSGDFTIEAWIRPGDFYNPPCPVPHDPRYVALIEHGANGLAEVSAKGYRRIPLLDPGNPLIFPIAEEDWGFVSHVGVASTEHGPIEQMFDWHTWHLTRGGSK